MKRILIATLGILMILTLALSACQPATTDTSAGEPVAEEPAADEPAAAEPATAEEETAPEAETNASTVGGTFQFAISVEPDTFDPHKTSSGSAYEIMSTLGASLIYLSPEGEFCPYLAESFQGSEDGLTWVFKLREDVTFHDGTPLTANDYAWTFNRALDPNTASPVSALLLGAVTSAEALDDYTLQINLAAPNFPLLYGLASIGYMQPLPKATFEAMGEEEFARNPVGVGPYVFKEWQTGERIITERNPDYNWRPACVAGEGPLDIETIEWRVIPEQAIVVAGLEAGEIDLGVVQPQDLQRFEEMGTLGFFEIPGQGIMPAIGFNTSRAPFDDVRVRQAVNMAIDRELIVDIVFQGAAVPQQGPISSSVMGYWEGIEELGYPYDPEAARQLLVEAGYTLNADGIFEKDGQLFEIDFYTPSIDIYVKTSEVLQEQLRQIGIAATIKQMEVNLMYAQLAAGDYDAGLLVIGYGEADLMYLLYHSSMIGALNFSFYNNPELDALLERTRTEIDPAARQEVVNEVQKHIVENAVIAPIVTPVTYYAFNNRVIDLQFNSYLALVDFFNAHISE